MSPPRSFMGGIQLSFASLTIISLQPWGFSLSLPPNGSSLGFPLYLLLPSSSISFPSILFFFSTVNLGWKCLFHLLFNLLFIFFLLARSILIAPCAGLGRAGRGCGGLGCPLSALLLVAQSKTSKKKPSSLGYKRCFKALPLSPLITSCSGSPLAGLRSRSILRLGDAGASVRQLP